MSEELKPCPHCGGKVIITCKASDRSPNLSIYIIWCATIGCLGKMSSCHFEPGKAKETKTKLIENWNTRAK
jgi:Lar family restriction alleviation protein